MNVQQFLNRIKNNTEMQVKYSTMLQAEVYQELDWLPKQPLTEAELTEMGAALKGEIPFLKSVSTNVTDVTQADIVIASEPYELDWVTKSFRLKNSTVAHTESLDTLLTKGLSSLYVAGVYELLEDKIVAANRNVTDAGANQSLMEQLCKYSSKDCVLIVNTDNANQIIDNLQEIKLLGIEIHFAELKQLKYIVADRNALKLCHAKDFEIQVSSASPQNFMSNMTECGFSVLSGIAINPMGVLGINVRP